MFFPPKVADLVNDLGFDYADLFIQLVLTSC